MLGKGDANWSRVARKRTGIDTQLIVAGDGLIVSG
jgi:hypothetical protein